MQPGLISDDAVQPGTWVTLVTGHMGDARRQRHHGPQDTESKWPEMEVPESVVYGLHTDLLARERFADEHLLPLPLDAAVGTHAARHVAFRVAVLAQRGRHPPRRQLVDLRRRLHRQRLVRSLLVVDPLEAVERRLPCPNRCARRRCPSRPSRSRGIARVAILVRASRPDQHRDDADSHEPAPSRDSRASPLEPNGWPPSLSMNLSSPNTANARLRRRRTSIDLGETIAWHTNEGSAAGVVDRGRLAPRPVAHAEPAPVARRPHIVGLTSSTTGGDVGRRRRRCALGHQAGPLQDLVQSARWPRPIRSLSDPAPEDLLRAPARVRLAAPAAPRP